MLSEGKSFNRFGTPLSTILLFPISLVLSSEWEMIVTSNSQHNEIIQNAIAISIKPIENRLSPEIFNPKFAQFLVR